MIAATEPTQSRTPSTALASWRLIGILCAVFVLPPLIRGTYEHVFHLQANDLIRALIADPQSVSQLQRINNAGWNSTAAEVLSAFAIAIFLAWSSEWSLTGSGIVRVRLGRDLGVSLAIFVLDRIVTAIQNFLIWHATYFSHELFRFSQILTSLHPTQAVVVALTIVFFSISQEVLFRGLLVPALQEVSGSATTALAISTLLFASSHFGEGWYAMPGYLLFGVVAGWAFLRTGSIWPAVIGHGAALLWSTL